MRDAFGRLLDPVRADRLERVDELRRVAGRLHAAEDRGSRWLGGALLDWLHGGGDLADRLGVRPPRGSRRTHAQMLRQARQDAALLRLAAAVGCDRLALAILRGAAQCSADCAALLADAQALEVPTGPHAISRARRRDRRSPMKRSSEEWAASKLDWGKR